MRMFFAMSWLVLVMATACNEASKSQSEGQKRPEPSFSNLPSTTDIFPLANGTALAISWRQAGKAIYLLSGNQSIKVAGVPTDRGFPDPYPLADGSAYITFTGAKGLSFFHLVGHELVQVHETGQLTNLPEPSTTAGFLFAEHASKKTRNDRASEKVEP